MLELGLSVSFTRPSRGRRTLLGEETTRAEAWRPAASLGSFHRKHLRGSAWDPREELAAMVWKKLGSGNFSSCPNGSLEWIWDVFGECAQDGWDEASVGLGLISILCFAASTFPQYIKACKTGNMDQALSLWFLLGWIGGDSCNLIGSFLADQLPLQTYTAVYYVLADLLMLSLYFHYKFKKRPSLCLSPSRPRWRPEGDWHIPAGPQGPLLLSSHSANVASAAPLCLALGLELRNRGQGQVLAALED
ncbi:lysosomal amino acid transporter 1 homolog isoform X3 [Acinonyx jubatus]|uniref:Lysosomal amino acid transporter 1 homolog isoform X3 n=1 Tax=Acinonyx jubatus TaxID=32536 RepID=A0A6J1ZF26_ACIJB|nr:lysosomal amino acid transporter 1 homolog isoform X3 [Acinonyx jubatus]